MINKPSVILLDVYETMLNMSEVEKRVNALMDNRRGYAMWFELFMQYCFVDNCTVQFNDFISIAKATMQMIAQTLGQKFDNEKIDQILNLLKHLPLQEHVQQGLSLLYDQKFRIAALTNSPYQTVIERMERTGLISYFEAVLSAEHVKKYKPCIEVYSWAATKLKARPQEIMVVSAHGWDIAGAANAGMQTAYLQQDKQMLYPLAPKPNLTCVSITDLAKQLETL